MQPKILRILQFGCLAVLTTAPVCGQSTGAGGTTTDPLAAFKIAGNITNDASLAALADIATNSRQQFIDYLKSTTTFVATFPSLLRSIETGRVDEQAGASATAGGAARAAGKAGTTGLITAALERGAVAQNLGQKFLHGGGDTGGLYR